MADIGGEIVRPIDEAGLEADAAEVPVGCGEDWRFGYLSTIEYFGGKTWLLTNSRNARCEFARELLNIDLFS